MPAAHAMAHAAARSFLLCLLLAGCDCRGEACDSSADCEDDGLFCTAPPYCSRASSTCVQGGSPCGPDAVCEESTQRCVFSADAGPPDAGLTCEERVPGTACTAFSGCDLTSCQEATYSEWGSSVREDGTPGRPFPVAAFPGGYCAAPCDASRLNDECGSCADCSGIGLAGSVRLPLVSFGSSLEGVCREHCTPSSTSTGCPRAGYTCDLETSTCMEACVDDRQCQIVLRDTDGDGSEEVIDRGEAYPAYCDAATGRCRTRGTAGAQIGDRCTEDFQCPDDGTCYRQPGAAEGLCTRLGCIAEGFGCEEPGTSCDVRNVGTGRSGCLRSCRVGVEDATAAMRGATGGNPDCAPGLACVWNGLAEMGDALAGSCVIGEYNDRQTPNIGAPCSSADDCDSPFGYGVCLFSEYELFGTGMCTVQSCATFLGPDGDVVQGLLPGVSIASPICDPARGELCMNLANAASPPETYCLRRCNDATECAPGYACTQLLSGEARFCWPLCYDAGDCRVSCDSALNGGPCAAGDDYCLCSDRPSP